MGPEFRNRDESSLMNSTTTQPTPIHMFASCN
jgi:hypothetical protein